MFGLFDQQKKPGGLFDLSNINQPMLYAGLGMLSGRNNQEAFGNAAAGALTGYKVQEAKEEKDEKKKAQQALSQYIGAQGLDPNLAAALQANPQMAQAYVSQAFRPDANLTADLREYYAAKKEGFDGNFVDWKARARGGATELSLNPQYGLDAEGNPVLIQIGKDGKAVRTALPDGVTLDRSWVNAQSEAGKLRGQAQADLPGALETARNTLSVIDQALAHPGRQAATGKSSVLDPRNYIPGTEARDYVALHNQIKGRAFLEAYQTLKGGGQITEIEGIKAEQAIARLDLAQSDEAYERALRDLRDVVERGMERARQRAGVKGPASQQQSGGNRTSSGVQWKVVQ